MVTVNEVVDVMKESPIWETLSLEEQIEAINYAFEMAMLKTENIVYEYRGDCWYPQVGNL